MVKFGIVVAGVAWLILLGSVGAGEQRAWLVVDGACLRLDTRKVELWVPMVDGVPDRKHGELRHVVADYDANCGVYRITR